MDSLTPEQVKFWVEIVLYAGWGCTGLLAVGGAYLLFALYSEPRVERSARIAKREAYYKANNMKIDKENPWPVIILSLAIAGVVFWYFGPF